MMMNAKIPNTIPTIIPVSLLPLVDGAGPPGSDGPTPSVENKETR